MGRNIIHRFSISFVSKNLIQIRGLIGDLSGINRVSFSTCKIRAKIGLNTFPLLFPAHLTGSKPPSAPRPAASRDPRTDDTPGGPRPAARREASPRAPRAPRGRPPRRGDGARLLQDLAEKRSMEQHFTNTSVHCTICATLTCNSNPGSRRGGVRGANYSWEVPRIPGYIITVCNLTLQP